MPATVFNATCAELGEGPLWADGRLYWFDILGEWLYTQAPGGEAESWRFEEYHSAAAAIEGGGLLIASETGLWRFDPATGVRALIAPLEADDPGTRSNAPTGRAASGSAR